MNDITLMLRRVEQGDAGAAEEVLSMVYQELRRLAAYKMSKESAMRTMQPTDLVHEAWLRLGGDAQPAWQNRAHFFSAAAEAMRRILIDQARRRLARKHGGGLDRVNVDEVEVAAPVEGPDGQLLAVHEALERLSVKDARKAELVKLRYFVGMTIEEAAEALAVSVPTAKRDWAYARAWLFEEIAPGQ